MAENNTNLNSNAWGGQRHTEDEQSIQLADLWAMIWNHKWWYIFSLLLCLIVAGYRLYKTPKLYSRSEKVIIDEDSQASAMRNLTAFAGNYRGYYSGTNVDNEMEAFGSPDLMQRVVERLGLETSYTEKQFLRTRELYKSTPFEVKRLGDNVASSFSFSVNRTGDSTFVLKNFKVAGKEVEETELQGAFNDSLVTPAGALCFVPTIHLDGWTREVVVSYLNSRARGKGYAGRLGTSVSSKQSSVVVLTITDQFPARAEAILSTLLDVYNEDWVSSKTLYARNTSEFINERLLVIEKELGGIESNLRDYKEAHKITNIQQVSTAYLQQSGEYSSKNFEINNQISVAKYIKEYLNDPAHARDLIPANVGLQNTNVAAQISEYNATLLKRDALLKESSENNPLIQDLNTTLDALKIAVGRSIDNLISTLQLQLDKINTQERNIMSRIASTTGQELELLSIERQQKVKEQLYVFLLQKREENELQSLLTVGNTRLIQSPTGGGGPVSPNKMMILLIAVVLGLGVPFAIFYLLKILDTSVKSRNDLNKISIPFLAEIPQVGLSKNYFKKLRADRFDAANTRILVQSGKRDMVNEAFRVLRTNLDL
ncbi:MAG: hypothetical protein IKX37_05540, partial [Bacteroidales bacterium]|nr:hypothetical protein [Bacteroidales bacterium]